MAQTTVTQNPTTATRVFVVQFYNYSKNGNYTFFPALSRSYATEQEARAYGILACNGQRNDDGTGLYFKVVEKYEENTLVDFDESAKVLRFELEGNTIVIDSRYEALSKATKEAYKNPTAETAQNLLKMEKAIKEMIENYAKALRLLEKPAKTA